MTSERREGPDEQTDFDRRFAEIVAQFEPDTDVWDDVDRRLHETAADKQARTEEHESAQDRAEPADPPGVPNLPSQWRIPADDQVSFLDDDGDFVPADPRPLPDGDDIGFWAMIGCLVGGPAWLLYLVAFDRYAQSLWWVLACALFVAGVVMLVIREPKSRDDDDDGAVL